MFTRRPRRARYADTADDAPVDDGYVEREERVRPGGAFSPSQVVAFVIGAAAIAMGTVALIRTGLDVERWYEPVRSVLGFAHTPLLAVSVIGFGILMLLAALSPAGRGLMALLGIVALLFGIAVVAGQWDARLREWFGVTDRNGWLFVAVGAVSIAGAFLPAIRGADRRQVTEHRRTGEPTVAR